MARAPLRTRATAFALPVVAVALALATPRAEATCSHPADDPTWSFVFRCADVYTENPFTAIQHVFLTPNQPGDHLISDYVRIGLGTSPQATSQPSTEYIFAPFGSADSFYFSQVNAFYHGNKFLSKLGGYGYDPTFHPVWYTVQNPPQGGSSTFSSGAPNPGDPVVCNIAGPGRSDGKDADVVVHESTHGVFNFLIPVPNSVIAPQAVHGASWEWTSLAEGLADYYASAQNGNTVIGEYSGAPNGGYYDINTSPSTFRYDNNIVFGDPYNGGKVFNGALVTLRARFGVVIDELVFDATFFITDGCFPCFFDAIRAADINAYGGSHLTAIDSAFTTIRHIPASIPVSTISGPQFAAPDSSVPLSVFTQCGVAPFTYAWDSRPHGTSTFSSTGLTGADVNFTMPNQATDLRVQVTDALSGVTVSDTITILLDLGLTNGLSVSIAGPSTPGTDEYGLVWNTPSHGSTNVTWELESNGVKTPLGARASVRAGRIKTLPTLRVRVPRGTDASILRARVEESTGRVATASLRIEPSTPGPAIRIDGPEYLDPNQSADFRARVTGGTAPYTVRWVQDGGEDLRTLGEGDVVRSATMETGFRLCAIVKDAQGRVSSAQMAVGRNAVASDRNPAVGKEAFALRVSPSVVPSGQTVKFALEHLNGAFNLSLTDVMGRVVWHQSGAAAGSASATWVPRGVAPGLFFARCQVPGQPTVKVKVIVTP